MRKQIVLLLVLLVAYSTTTVGQEVLLDLQTMPMKKVVKLKSSLLKVKSKSSLGLPFFDDFAKGLSYPDPGNWINSSVIINQTYAINPPSIGVATFDAIDQFGKLYSHLTASSLPADTLTSQLINTDTSTNVYFSFQYEPKGLGKEPSLTDSLVIEFFSKNDKEWFRVWSASPHFSTNTIIENFHLESRIVTRKATKIDETFFKVIMPIYDERFLQDSFQFRFINYASLPTNTQVPSLRGNGDQWHIDYLYLNRNRYEADTIPFDVVFSQPMKSILKDYESIPWKHFTPDVIQTNITTGNYFMNIQFRNLSNDIRNVYKTVALKDLSDPAHYYRFDANKSNLEPLTTRDSMIFYEYEYSSTWSDSAKFSVESYLENQINSESLIYKWNDTIKHIQKFLNYYAYDDGSAENGYGLYGNGSEYGMVALKYNTYLEDSLKGVEMYFNRSLQDDNLLYIPDSVEFYLTVWSDNNGKPGSILYQSDKLKPKFKNGVSSFSFYPVSKLKVSGNFWIGWANTTTDFLNVGFDLNNIHNDKLYYNLNGSWVQSQFEGSLMIHPVFGYLTKNQQTGIVTPTQKTNFTIYPNPTSSQVNLRLPEGVNPERIRVFNLAGQVVVDKVYDSNSIDVSNLTTGIYLLQLTIKNSSPSTQKLVIIR